MLTVSGICRGDNGEVLEMTDQLCVCLIEVFFTVNGTEACGYLVNIYLELLDQMSRMLAASSRIAWLLLKGYEAFPRNYLFG